MKVLTWGLFLQSIKVGELPPICGTWGLIPNIRTKILHASIMGDAHSNQREVQKCGRKTECGQLIN